MRAMTWVGVVLRRPGARRNPRGLRKMPGIEQAYVQAMPAAWPAARRLKSRSAASPASATV
jgi:hypothetical protein